MIEFSETDIKLLKAMIKRGWVSTRYLNMFYDNDKYAVMRMKTLEKNDVVKSCSINKLLTVDKHTRSILPKPYNKKNMYFHKLTDDFINVYDKEGLYYVADKVIEHQIYQEYIELEFINTFKIENIQANPDLKPKPDLYFEYKNKNYSVEIERNIKTNISDWIERKTLVNGEVRERRRYGFNYQSRVDSLLKFSECVIYYVSNEKDLKKLDRKIQDRKAYIGLLTEPHTLYDYNLKKLTLESLMNG